MARASQRRNTVRKDPPVTMIDPSQQNLMLIADDGTPLEVSEVGHSDGRFTYVWVDKANQSQFSGYQAMGYEVCRKGQGGAKPRFDVYIDESEDAGPTAVITRGEMILMRRTLEMSHAYIAAGKQAANDRLEAQGQLPRELRRRAAHGSMMVERADAETVDRD